MGGEPHEDFTGWIASLGSHLSENVGAIYLFLQKN